MNDLDTPLISDAPPKNRKFFITAACVIVIIVMGFIPGFYPFLFGIMLPYIAIITFIIGFIYRVVNWGKSPVPFRIPTTSGQAKSLPWIKADNLEAPHNTWGVIGRMFLEIFFFRSLFRNTLAELRGEAKLAYSANKYLWAAALAFHWCFFIIFLRHLRFFTEPVPEWLLFIQDADALFQIGLPVLFMTDVIILCALGFLLLRRMFDARIRYISLPADYFALILILCIVLSGMMMRHITKVDITEVKKLSVGLLTLSPSIPKGVGLMFYIHFFCVSVLLAYFPFSKLMHMPGVFLSPTRNMINNNRVKRHVNPWNHPVKVHTYEEYEDEFRDKMKAAGLPLEKE